MDLESLSPPKKCLFTSYSASSGGSVVNQVKREFDGRGQLTIEWQEHSGAVTATSAKVQYGYAEESSSSGMFTRLVSIIYPDGKEIDYNCGSPGSVHDWISRVAALVEASTSLQLEAYEYLGMGTVVKREFVPIDVSMTYFDGNLSGSGDAGDQDVGLDFRQSRPCR